ncbi:hypothetical protein scyTo_0002975 [Scyliorhinus torazame]|uniref:HELP domain-containing protein n=1 Tax=Scyliorhinus torazame TaxID=75743 RepID=A0A401PLA4_SCYTO|nr:hypothetical protein [Scyliorhinus torazame]
MAAQLNFVSSNCDDSISGASTSDVQDRLSSLELRVQQQEDEITVLKAALADVLRRLALSEDQTASMRKTSPGKGQPALREAYSLSCITNGSPMTRKSMHSSALSVARKETLSSAAKSYGLKEQKNNPEKIEKPQEKETDGETQSNHQTSQSSQSPQPQRHTPENKNPTSAKSVKRGSTIERSHSSGWEGSDEHRNKMLKAHSTSKLLSKHKSSDKSKEPAISQAQSSRRGAYSQEGDMIKMFMRGRPITMYIPSDVTNYDEMKSELSSEKLKLEWVYGYRGRDCRSNIYLLPTGEIIYFIASVVVLYNVEERTQRHYLGHTDCVKCLAVHPDKIKIATGQIAGVDKDGRPLQPHVRVWDSVSLATLQIIGLGTFERGVGSLAFSKADSGTHLCVVDDSNEHMLTVWEWQKKSKIAEIKSTNESVLAADFHPTDPNTIVTCGKSHVFFWTWNGNSLARKQGIFGKYEKPKFVQCLAFLENGDVLTGDSGGIMLIWNRTTVESAQGKGPKDSLFLQVPDQFGAIRAVAEGKGDQFLIGTSRNFILRGTFNDGFQIEVQEPGHCAEFHPSGVVVAIGTHSGRWFVLDAETKDLVSIHTDGNEQLSVMRYSPDGNYLAVGSHDNFIYIYTVAENGRKYSRQGKCTGHSSYITHLDWSPDTNFIMSNSGDYEILYWDIQNGCKLIRNRSECRDMEWYTYTCVLGFHVFGVWPEGSDGTDINALCRSHSKKVVAVADDFCKVHIFQYPISKPKAPSHVYSAHSSHVTNVSFTYSDGHLISTGGKDTSIIQWRVTEKNPLPSNGNNLEQNAPSSPADGPTENAPVS